MGWARTSLLLVALAPVYGCAAQDAACSELADAATDCREDAHCPPGYVCDPQSHTCIADTSVPLDLVLSIRPLSGASGSGYLAGQYVELTGRLDSLDTRIELDPVSTVTGTVRRVSGEYVEARLEFSPRVTGFPDDLRRPQSTTSVVEDLPGEDNFSIALLEGTYDVTVSPRGTDANVLPPLYAGEVEIQRDTDTTFDVTFPASHRTLSGTLRLSNDDPVPHSLKVWAVDAVTGKRVSTVATTGSGVTDSQCAGTWDTGRFCLVLSTSASLVRLQVAPGEDSSQAAAYPTTTIGSFDTGTLDDDADGAIDLDTDSPNPAKLPPLGDVVIYKAKVEGVTTAGLTEPVEGASVNFTAERGDASFDVYSITNSSGEVCHATPDGELVWGVMLRENDYEVTIIPPMGTQFESLVLRDLTVTYADEGVIMGQVYQLTTKRPLLASVESLLTGEPLEGLNAEAYPVAAADTAGPSFPLPRYNDGLTGVDGLLRLELDRGVYDVLIRSTLTDGVGWMWLQDESPDNEDDPLEVRMPAPIPLSGTVLHADSTPAGGALVQVHEVVRPPDPEEPPDTRLIWDTTAGSDGSFTVLLSP